MLYPPPLQRGRGRGLTGACGNVPRAVGQSSRGVTLMRIIDHILLSHHATTEHYRCLRLKCHRKCYIVCARCSGVAIGLLMAVALIACRVALPPPAIYPVATFDWVLSMHGVWRGHNSIRVASGILIGACYAQNWLALAQLRFTSPLLIADGGMIAIYATSIIWLRFSRQSSQS